MISVPSLVSGVYSGFGPGLGVACLPRASSSCPSGKGKSANPKQPWPLTVSKSDWDLGGFEEEVALELYFKRMRRHCTGEGVGPPDRKNPGCKSMEAHSAKEPQVTPSSGQKHQGV